MESGKRNAEEMEAKGTSLTVSKRRKKVEEEKKELTSWEKEGILRTSKLEAPTMLLSGHKDEIYGLQFSPGGDVIASGSKDKHVFLWRVYGSCENFMVLKGHKNAVLELHWTTDAEKIVTASADKTARLWDVEVGLQVKNMKGHTAIVNSCCPARRGLPLVVTCSDDSTARIWDLRMRGAAQTLSHEFPLTAVAFSDGGDHVYTGGIDNIVRVWDFRKDKAILSLEGHGDTITGLSVSADGRHLLSNAMDGTLKAWDMRPFCEGDRCVQTFAGHSHGFEQNLLRCAWSPDGTRVTCGSSDCLVYVWDFASGKLIYRLPGHTGSVNEVTFHPSEPIIGSCSSDRQIFMGEIEDD